MVELLINGVDAWSQYGVKMGVGFIDALETPADLKERIVNTSRLFHGDRYVAQMQGGQPTPPKLASRQLTLQFVIMGVGDTLQARQASFRANKARFIDLLQGVGEILIQVPKVSHETYHLLNVAKSNSYGVNQSRTVCKLSVKFVEPDPTNRGNLEIGEEISHQGEIVIE